VSLPAETRDRVVAPLTDRVVAARADKGCMVMIGLCGAQGSGKTTVASATVEALAARGLRAVALSIDDVYLTRGERLALARAIHPLCATRGPPGTHDIALAQATLRALGDGTKTALPAFDKATDDRAPQAVWRVLEGPLDAVILEGWCVGARPEPDERLELPINDLEAREDAEGRWRRWSNDALAERYQSLFAKLDALVLLAAPGFEVVRGWRTEQEQALRLRTGAGLSDNDVGRFVQHYERLTRWILAEMPARADWTIRLDRERRPQG